MQDTHGVLARAIARLGVDSAKTDVVAIRGACVRLPVLGCRSLVLSSFWSRCAIWAYGAWC